MELGNAHSRRHEGTSGQQPPSTWPATSQTTNPRHNHTNQASKGKRHRDKDSGWRQRQRSTQSKKGSRFRSKVYSGCTSIKTFIQPQRSCNRSVCTRNVNTPAKAAKDERKQMRSESGTRLRGQLLQVFMLKQQTWQTIRWFFAVRCVCLIFW